ncbi:MAG: outer membrane beta-barrel protein [Crocinitomicaceae bacterium]
MPNLFAVKSYTFLMLFSVFFVGAVYSQQSSYLVKGKLISQAETVPYAAVLVKSEADSTIAKSGFSDSLGYFNIEGVLPGKYFLTASMIGYEKYSSPSFEVIDENVEFGDIEILADIELEGVDVVALRPIIEVRPDKTIFNVDGTINATGTNLLELLRKAPGIIVDNNNNILIEGKSGGQVFFDGKPSFLSGDDLANYLRSMQASDVDKIEIISQPSSKYDAAGNGGIVNIVMKRDKRLGVNGTAALGYAYGVNHHLNSSFSLNYRSKKTNVYGMYSNGFGKNYRFMYMDRRQLDTLYEERMESNDDRTGHNGKVGVDWFVKKNHVLGVLVSGSLFSESLVSESTTRIGPDGFTSPSQILEANNRGEGENYQLMGNLNYRFEDTLGHEFSVDFDYGVFNREREDYLPNAYRQGSTGNLLFENNDRMITPTEIDILTAKFDYGQYLFKGRVELGAKFSSVLTTNTLDFYDIVNGEDVLNENRSNQFDYSERIAAGYVNYLKDISNKWSFQLGLRAEQTNSIGELTSIQTSNDDYVERSYLNLFPSGGLTYNHNRDHIWSVNFSRRIDRPNYQTLNPFTWQINDLSSRRGNPFLLPQYGNNVRLSHTFKYRFNTSLSYSFVENYFAEISDTLGTNGTFMMTRNVADEQIISLSTSLPFNFKKWWSLFVGINSYYSIYTSNDERFVPIQRFTVSGFIQNTFLLKKGFKLEVSGWFSSPSVWGGTYLSKSMGSLDVAVEKRLFKDRLSARLGVSDVFFTSPWRADVQYGELSIYGTGGWESRMVRFNLTYFFGRSEIEKSRNRKTGLEEEGGRTGTGGGR